MLSQLSPQGGVLGSPQSPVLQISGPIFHLNHKSINDSLSTFQKYNLVMFTAILPTAVLPTLTSNCVYSKRLQFIATEYTVGDPIFGAIWVLGLSLCYYCA